MPRLILHLADLHLGHDHAYLGGSAAARAREANAVLDRIADWLAAPGAPAVGAVLIAGDLFQNPWPEDSLVASVERALRRIVGAGIAVVTVPGNHDEWTYPNGVFRHRAGSWPGWLVTCREPEIVAVLDLDGVEVEIASCAYEQGCNPPSAGWKNPFGRPRGSSVRRLGLFHGTLDRIGGKLLEGERAFRLDFEHLAGWELDYLALGHIHLRKDHGTRDCPAFYPGPVEGSGFDDPGAVVLTLLDLSGPKARTIPVDAHAIGVRTREIETVEIEAVAIAGREDLERRILEAAGANGPERIVRFVVSGAPSFSFRPEDLARDLAPRFLHLEVVASDPAAELGAWESLASQPTLDGIFVARALDERSRAATPEERVFWDEVAHAGLRALDRGRA